MPKRASASRGSLGGAAGEAGSEFRALVGAIFASAILTDATLADVGLHEIQMQPSVVIVEGDLPVDDLIVEDPSGNRVMTQAKIGAGLAPGATSPTAEAFRQFAAAVKAGLDSQDRLVLATARPTAGLRRLIDVLERERCTVAGLRSAGEHEAADRLNGIARHFLNAEETEELFRRLTIWSVDPPAYESAVIARLEGVVTAGGAGRAGTTALKDQIRELGRLRAGADAESLLDGLITREVPIAQGANTAQIVEEENLIAAHRQRIRHRGEKLQLYQIAGELGELPLLDADCDLRVTSESARNREENLQVVLRRHRRVLLLGDAGSGKSTALRALGAHAARTAGWPVPIVAHVGRLVKTDESLTRRLLALATEDAAPEETSALSSALGRRLSSGRALLILDGFDEIPAWGWKRAMARLKPWLDELPASTEVIIATRPVAAGPDATGALSLEAFQLLAPDRPTRTVTAILEAVAAADPERCGDQWIDDRQDWLTNAFARDRELGARPLTIVNLAVIAARSAQAADLPATRSQILLASLDEASRRWELEQREGELTVGRLSPTEAKHAVALALRHLSALALLSAGESEEGTMSALADKLGRDFGLEEASARSAADDALAFWLRAGVFAIEDGVLIARIRSLAEVGVAESWARSARGDYERILEQARSDRASSEILVLSAGLSPSLRTYWAHEVAVNGSPDEVIALVDACRESDMPEHHIVGALLRRFPELATNPEDAERVAEALALLPLREEQKDQLRDWTLRAVRPDRQIVMRAMFICTWEETDGPATATLREFVSSEWPVKAVEPPDDGIIHIPDDNADSLYQYVHDQAILRIASLSREDAELATNHYHPSGVLTGSTLGRLLREHGHRDLAEQVGNWWRLNLDWEDDAPATTPQLLSWAAELAPPRQLTFEEQRRLQELADLVASTAFNWVRPSQLERHQDEFQGWVCAVARLAGFDLPLLAGEARSFADELANGGEDEFFIYQHGKERFITNWNDVEDPDQVLDDLLGALRVVPEQASRQLLHAFSCCLTPARASAEAIRMLPRATGWRATLIADVALLALAGRSDAEASHLARTWLDEAGALIRISAAQWFSAQVRSAPRIDRDRRRCLSDEDAAVRVSALDHLSGANLETEHVDLLRELARRPTGIYTCTLCGTRNDSTAACLKCHGSAPNIAARVSAILDPPPKPRTASDFAELFKRHREPRRVRRPGDRFL